MTHWQTVFRYELTRQLQRKAFWFVTVGFPTIAFLVLLGYLGYQEIRDREGQSEKPKDEFEGTTAIGYVDQTGYFTPPAKGSPFEPVVMFYGTMEAGEQALETQTITLLYVIGEDYFETGKVAVVLRDISFDVFDHALMEAFLVNSLAREVDTTLLTRLRFPIMALSEQKVDKDGSTAQAGNTDTNFLVVYIFALALMMSTFMSSGYLMGSIVEEKENKIIEIILTSVKPFPLLLGKTLATGLTGLFQMLVWVLAAFALFQVASAQIVDLSQLDVKPLTIVIALIYFLLGFGVVGSVFAAMGAIVSNTRDGSQLVGWIVMPFIIPLFFTTVFATSPDGTLARVLSIVPFTAPLAMVMRVSVSSVPWWEILISVVFTLCLVVACIWLAGRMFRVGSLLRGSPAKFRDLPRLIWEG